MPDYFNQTTIRTHLLSVVVDHLMKGGITCAYTHQLGCELVALLSAYREEERHLFPEVYVIAATEGDPLRIIAPGVTPLSIGKIEIDKDFEAGAREAARAILKNCASLAIDGWAIYIHRDQDGFSYGLFYSSPQSYSVGAAAVLVNSSLPAVILRNSAENTVEIANSTGMRLEISLTTATPSNRSMSSQIMEFAQAACQDVPGDDREQASAYLNRLLTDFLRASHGALLAVAPITASLESEHFSGGVVFDVPVPLVTLMLSAVKEQSATAESMLRSHESLLRGMIMSDGITVLGADGSMRAFRVLVNIGGEKADKGKIKAGGARTRAFDVLKRYLNEPFTAILFRSQDGRTNLEIKT